MPKILLVCYISPKIGMGHLSRLMALAQALKKAKKIIPEFLIFGKLIKKDNLGDFKVYNLPLNHNFESNIENLLDRNNFNGVVFDIYQNHIINVRKMKSL